MIYRNTTRPPKYKTIKRVSFIISKLPRIENIMMEINNVSCLHLVQNNGKLKSVVSCRNFIRALFLKTWQNNHYSLSMGFTSIYFISTQIFVLLGFLILYH